MSIQNSKFTPQSGTRYKSDSLKGKTESLLFRNSRQQGSVLLEMLVVIAVIALIAGGLGTLFYSNQRGANVGRQSTLETSLTQEALEALKAILATNDSTSQGWNRVYCPPATVNTEGGNCASAGAKGVPPTDNPYHVQVVGNVWKLYTTSETVTIGDEAYTRAVYIENVCRNDTTGQITGSTDTNGSTTACVTNGGTEDPFTQKITVKITPPAGAPVITVVSFITRALNKQSSPSAAPAEQTDWSGGKDASCATSTVTSYGNQYCSDDTNPDVTGTAGSIKILTQ